MSAGILTLLQQYRVVVSVSGSPVMMAPTATDVSIVGGVVISGFVVAGAGAVLSRLRDAKFYDSAHIASCREAWD